MFRVIGLCCAWTAISLAQVAPPNSAGVSMGHLHIVTPHPEQQRKIWVDVLGGTLVKIGPLEFARFPGVLVGFRSGDAHGGTDGSVVDHLGFAVRELAATKANLTAAGVQIIRDMPETKQFFALFPDDIRVEFTEDTTQQVPIRHHHLHFASDQVDTMRAWYADRFGAVPGMRGRFRAADLPGVNLSWTPSEKPRIPTKDRALDHIGFEVRDIAAFTKKLEAAGAKLDMGLTRRDDLGLTIAFLTDPWGTRIELTEGFAKF